MAPFPVRGRTEKGGAPLLVVGAGYVGLLTAISFAKSRDVHVVDVDVERIEGLRRRRAPFYEPGLEHRLNAVWHRLTFHTHLQDALCDERIRHVFVAVGTPPRGAGAAGQAQGADDGRRPSQRQARCEAADLDAVEDVIAALAAHGGLAAVMKSTVPPGTGRRLLEQIAQRGEDLVYLSCPEFLREGDAFACIDQPDRIVVGCEAESRASRELFELHAELHPQLRGRSPSLPYLQMDITSAEAVKHLSNLHLAMRVSYANETASLCEHVGADVLEVLRGVGADARIGTQFMSPGVGFGGSCFAKDVKALRFTARVEGLDLPLADAVLAVNERQPVRVVDKLERHLEGLPGRRIALLGLTFKPHTTDLRASPAFAIAALLRRRGAQVRAFDPRHEAREQARTNWESGKAAERLAPEEIAESALQALTQADAAVIVTAWPELAEIDWHAAAQAMTGPLVIDGRNLLQPEQLHAAGLRYEGTGHHSELLLRATPEGTAER